MTACLPLPARLDLTAAQPLARDLAQIDGDITLDASGVTHLGGLCLQILLAARQHCLAGDRHFGIPIRSDAFDEALAQFGVDPQLLEGKGAVWG